MQYDIYILECYIKICILMNIYVQSYETPLLIINENKLLTDRFKCSGMLINYIISDV